MAPKSHFLVDGFEKVLRGKIWVYFERETRYGSFATFLLREVVGN
jgi:hypothetical protein